MEDKKNIENIINELKECKRLREEYLTGWKRERADFLNFKRDEQERIGRAVRSIEKDISKRFLPILDNICLAEKNIPENLREDAWVKGVMNMKDQATRFLEEMGIKEIKCLQKEFDPNIHEAVEVKEGDYSVPTVVEEVQKGYIIGETVIRPAKVKVANKIDKK